MFFEQVVSASRFFSTIGCCLQISSQLLLLRKRNSKRGEKVGFHTLRLRQVIYFICCTWHNLKSSALSRPHNKGGPALGRDLTEDLMKVTL